MLHAARENIAPNSDLRSALVGLPRPDALEGAAQRFTTAYLGHSRETPRMLDGWLSTAGASSARPHAAKALMLVTAGRSEVKVAARAAALEAVALASHGDFRDRIFADAALAAADGDWINAVQGIETLMRLEPENVLLVKLCHALRFMLGDKAGLIASVEGALRRLSPDHPHRGFVLGMHAFALEEAGHYAEAERTGRKAVMLRPDDVWGIHAVSHAQEMTGQVEAGIRWISGHETSLRAANSFGGHLFWHLALFRLERGEIGEVFALYDREIRHEKTDDFRDIANATSLLARLEREGHAVGDRWEELADKAEARIADRAYVFADLHYMLALAGAGRRDAARRLAHSLNAMPAAYRAQSEIAREIGAAVAAGILEADANPAAAFRALQRVRPLLQRIGGSDAQRDVFEQLLIDCAIRSGESTLARSILTERLAARAGRNAFASTRLARLATAKSGKLGGLALLSGLAFARPIEAGHQH